MQFLGKKMQPVLILLAVIWAVEIVNFLLGHSFVSWGILPRSLTGLIGIPLAPFIHAGLWHALSNTLPLLILGGLLLMSDQKQFWNMTIFIILLSGMLVWLFARNSYHVGASGLVFGYFGALVTRAVIERSFTSLLIALATVMLYGGLLWGLVPVRSYISYEAHFFGLVAGILCAWAFRKNRRDTEKF